MLGVVGVHVLDAHEGPRCGWEYVRAGKAGGVGGTSGRSAGLNPKTGRRAERWRKFSAGEVGSEGTPRLGRAAARSGCAVGGGHPGERSAGGVPAVGTFLC